MSLDQLSYFVAVAEEQHLTRAAKRLHVSQPPLTRQIRQLEAELGVQLFERSPKGMLLLPVGEALLARAKEILRLVALTRHELTEARTTPESGRRCTPQEDPATH